ncbi:EFR1 family ferrodoxin [Methanocella sp. MCL-LM]|uniref:EFR1 family ferrodoxin n=1 Tax=Methanocella sp. MCL-LM TaxID=3412035 RepID=UPI003C72046F
MKSTIYYFSGTGNSLYVARRLNNVIPGGTLANMASLAKMPEIKESGDVIGLVFPVYFWDMPAFVAEFITKLKITGQPYIFGIATCGGGPGNTLHTLKRMIKGKGQKLSAGFILDMPSNAYVGFDLMTPKAEWKQMLETSEKRLAEASEVIAKREISPVPGRRSAIVSAVTRVMQAGATKGYNLPRHYKTNERCNGCGICERICPTANIKVTDKNVSWGDNCAYCQACFHWCPLQAIQLNRKTEKVPRYQHPQIVVKDMLMR